jgi:hypothetical protein
MGITAFGGIEKSTFSEGGVYVLPGVFRVKVLACKYQRTRTQKDAFIVEMEILESSHKDRQPGSIMSWIVTMDKEPALGNVKQFVATAAPCSMDAVNEEGVLFIVSDKNPFKGRILRIAASEITTKAGRPFTKVKWLEDAVGAAGAAAAAGDSNA